jgi:hypothetical protein
MYLRSLPILSKTKSNARYRDFGELKCSLRSRSFTLGSAISVGKDLMLSTLILIFEGRNKKQCSRYRGFGKGK